MGKINYNKAFALPNEVWNPVKGYEGLYKVSSMGRVKSLITGKILKPEKGIGGYLRVHLYKDGKAKHFKVHRLVAEAFLKPVAGKDCVNHLDEVKTSNHYSNLEYCSPKENANWGTRNERMAEKQRNAPFKSKSVFQFSLNGKFIKEWPSVSEVHRQLGYTISFISRCCLGKCKQAYGYIWRYK